MTRLASDTRIVGRRTLPDTVYERERTKRPSDLLSQRCYQLAASLTSVGVHWKIEQR